MTFLRFIIEEWTRSTAFSAGIDIKGATRLKSDLNIGGIPSVIWGAPSNKLFVAVHGNMSSKDDIAIALFAEKAAEKGYQVLSFDLPEHGDRKTDATLCSVQNCVSDLACIVEYARTVSNEISLFACSMGAYFSMLAYHDLALEQALFLSPILNMERIISNMMQWFQVSEDRLETEKEIKTPTGQTLYWDYYQYVKTHPIDNWDITTSILYGSDDNLTEYEIVSDFAARHHCNLKIMEHGEHYFHTDQQLDFYKRWLDERIITF